MSIKNRKYKDYNDYLHHQYLKYLKTLRKKSKKLLPEYFDSQVKSFEKRIKNFIKYIKGDKVLCMGARTGAEVAAFINLGFEESIGIDINPGAKNKYVVKGDFNHTFFEDKSFSSIYCNCIDHAWDLKLLSKEMRRVLEDKGVLILEIDHILKENDKGRKKIIEGIDKYESIMWDEFNDIKKSMIGFNFVDKFVSVNDIFLVAIFNKR